MATVKEINHDSSTNINVHYDTVVGGAVFTVNAAAALDGSTYGVKMDWDVGAFLSTLEESFVALAGTEFRFRFRVDFSNVTLNDAITDFFFVRLRNSVPVDIFEFAFNAPSTDRIDINTVLYRSDSLGETPIFSNIQISKTSEVCIELRAIRETADGNADGVIELFVNGISEGSIANADNFVIWNTGLSNTLISFESGDPDLTGTMYYDEWILDDNNAADLGCGAASLSLAAMTKPADVDAAGEFIYVALLDGGTPILTKISTALNADGTTVFNPGAGDNIGVQCGVFESDVVWVAGNFDGTNVIEKSEDGGSSFTVKDDGTIGDIGAFVIGPNNDARVLAHDSVNERLIETIDDGAIWTSNNVDPVIFAIARLAKNPQEVVIGNEADVTNSIMYSPNTGNQLVDYQTGVYPGASATGVIING